MAERSASDVLDTDATSVDRETCLAWLRQTRFDDPVTCVHCGSDAVVKRGQTARGAQRYECRACDRVFNDLTDTVFSNRRLAIEELFYIIRELPDRPVAEIARALDRSYDTVRDVATAVQTTAHEFDPAALRAAFAGADLGVTNGTAAAADTTEQTIIYIERATRDRLRAWKDDQDLTYDAALQQLLDTTAAPRDDAAPGTTPGSGSFTASGTGGLDERASVPLTKGTRKRLKVWKTRHGLTYDAAVRQLLDTAAAET